LGASVLFAAASFSEDSFDSPKWKVSEEKRVAMQQDAMIKHVAEN
jgi:hypothetical protein